jgi:hypothetical protein
MRILIELFSVGSWSLGLAFVITPIWSKWYLPFEFRLVRYLQSGEITVSILWFFHFSIRYPLPSRINVKEAEKYLPRV